MKNIQNIVFEQHDKIGTKENAHNFPEIFLLLVRVDAFLAESSSENKYITKWHQWFANQNRANENKSTFLCFKGTGSKKIIL